MSGGPGATCIAGFHASGQNYLVGGPGKVYAYECSASRIKRFTPRTGPDVIWHTNHPLANDDYNPAYRQALEEQKGATKVPSNSAVRLQALQNCLGKEETPGIAMIKALDPM